MHFGAQLTSISVANTWSLSRKYVHKNALQFPNSEIVLSRIPRHATFQICELNNKELAFSPLRDSPYW